MNFRFHPISACLAFAVLLSAGCSHRPFESNDSVFTGMNYSKLSAGRSERLYRAEMDYHRVLSGLAPLHAKLVARLRDGGSIIYAGDGYRLTREHRIKIQDGVRGFMAGASITLDESITGGAPLNHRQVYFEPAVVSEPEKL